MKQVIQKIKNTYHLLQAIIANIYYGFPSRKLKVIGITGTDGKTTTTHLIYHILKQAGKKVSMISTVYGKIGNKEYDTGLHTTTPDPFLVQKLLRNAVDQGEEYFVLETTSHALDQNRVWGVRYDVGVLSNVTHEHFDYHHNYSDYLQTKSLLLKRSNQSFINADDESYPFLIKLNLENVKTYGLIHKADYMKNLSKVIKNLASFNAYNYLVAYAVAKEIGFSDELIVTSIKSFILPPGRIDIVYKKDFTVIIDFAHTPNAIKKVLEAVRPLYLKENGRLIHVFGSAGLRDTSKRQLMGVASGSQADIVILTEEDHRTEDPETICREIEKGLIKEKLVYQKELRKTDSKKYSIITHRGKAIAKALGIVNNNDVVIITGKGHEKSLCRGTIEYPWDDKEEVKKILHL